MINIPTTDIMTLITGEADAPAKTEHGLAADISFLSVIDAKEAGTDLQADALGLLPVATTVRNAMILDSGAIKAAFSAVLTAPEPVMPPQDGQTSETPIDIPAMPTTKEVEGPVLRVDAKPMPQAILPNISEIGDSDRAVAPMIPPVVQGNDTAIQITNSAPLMATKEGAPPLLKSTTETLAQMPGLAADIPTATQGEASPSRINAANTEQADVVVPIVSLALMSAKGSGDHSLPVEAPKTDATIAEKPHSVQMPALAPPPPRADGWAPPNKTVAMPLQSADQRLPNLPATGQTANQIDPNIPPHVPSTRDNTVAPQPDLTTSGLYPKPVSQNAQGRITSPKASIERPAPTAELPSQPQPQRRTAAPLPTNTPTPVAPDFSTGPAMSARSQTPSPDAKNEVKPPQIQRTDAAPVLQSQSLSAPVQPAVLSPKTPLRETSEDHMIQQAIRPKTAAPPPLSDQDTITQTPRVPEAAPIVPTTEINRSEAIETLSSPELIPLETRSADSTALLRHDATVNRPEVMRHVAQQLADAARQMPDRPVELALNPEELGRVRLTFTATDGGIHVAVMAERGETMDLLRRHIETLAQEFREMGYKDVNFEFSRDGQNGAGHDESSAENSADHDGATVESQTLAPVQLSLEPSSGLDLRL